MSKAGLGGANQLATAGAGRSARENLAAAQEAALELLRVGTSMSETARSTGVARSTIYRWLNHDPAFRAAYNEWSDEVQQSCRSRLLMLTDKATTALEKALEAGDARSALQLLKGLKLLAPISPGSNDTMDVQIEMEHERKRRKIALRREAVRLQIDEITAEIG